MEFNFYLAGKVNRILINNYFYIRANIIKGLSVKFLLGNEFLLKYGVKINYNSYIYIFRIVFNIKVLVYLYIV